MRSIAIIEGLLLVGSNLALLPAIFYSHHLGLIPESAILSTVLVISTVYHLCQTGFLCILDIGFTTFQLEDHFWVYGALVWMILYVVGLDLPYRFTIFIWVQALLFPLILEFMEQWWFSGFAIGFLVLIAILLLSLVVKGIPRFNIFSMLAAVILIGTGFAFHIAGGDPTPPSSENGETNHKYAWLHSAWHIFVMLAAYYIIDLKHGNSFVARLFRWLNSTKSSPILPTTRNHKHRLKPKITPPKKKTTPKPTILSLKGISSTKKYNSGNILFV